jgi:NAD(P)-dependent dehydrogenase (short-subunit alcohol dehydrogenase family)
MNIRDSVAFITGANRGIGLVFAQQLLAAGVRKVYATARHPESIALNGAHRVRLDVTKPADVAAAARDCADLVINNAGSAHWTGFLSPGSVDSARAEMETHYYGPLLLALSWVAVPNAGTHSASKAAAWALTNWLRTALRESRLGCRMNVAFT